MNTPARILVVDDNAAVRLAVTRMLRQAGYELAEAGNGAEALRIARTNPPDLILLDMAMPVMDGATTRAAIKSDPALGGVLVLHLSAQRTLVEDRVCALRGGADGYLAWPVTQAELVATVEAFLRIKRTEDALRASEAQYRELVQGANSIILRLDPRGRVLFANDFALRFFGFAADELVGQNAAGTVVPVRESSGRDLEALLVEVCREPDSHAANENENTRRNGERVWVAWSNRGIRDADGNVVEVLCVGNDITERRRVEEALRTSEERLRQAVAASQTGILDHDHRTGALHWSPELRAISGIGPDEPESMAVFSAHLHPSDRERVLSAVQRANDPAGPGLFELEFRMVGTDGQERWSAVRSQTIFEGEGAARRAVRTVGAIVETTERKQAGEALRKSEEQHRTILQTAIDGFFVADTEGCLLEVNQAYCSMTGYSESELLTMRVHDLEVVEAPEDVQARTQEIIAHGQGRFESRHRCKDGRLIDVDASVQYRPTDGGRLVAFVRDITERVRAEEAKAAMEAELRQSQKMESVGRLAGGVAHDFNNMLSVIIGHVELAMDQVDPAEPLHADLQEIMQAAQRSADLTRQLLAFARKQTIAPRVHDLNKTVVGTRKLLQSMVGENLHIELRPGADLWPVKADASQIDQILANLCVNARDAIADAGTITIETENSTLAADFCADHTSAVPGDYVRLAVTDDGCGMDQALLAHIFEPFFTTKSVGVGTGLGLATVYGAVRQNNGFMHVDSKLGTGTTFAVYLPRHLGQVEPAHAGDAASVPKAQATVLLVEDEEAILAMSTRILEGQGYTVLPASTPAAALQLARAHVGEIHLLMTDVIMPEMNGRKLAKNVLSLHPGIKRLFMSGYTADVIAQHGVLDDGMHFIEKPFTRKALLAKVAEVLEGD